MTLRRLVLALATVAGIALLTGCDPSVVQNFVVNTTTDAPDATPGDGICEATTDAGDCTLRAAIDEANTWSGITGITLAPGETYPLTRAGADEDANDTGDLDLAEFVILEGNNSTIDAAGLDRVLDVGPTGTLIAARTTFTGGEILTSSGDDPHGGGIRSTGALTVLASTVTDNRAEHDTAGLDIPLGGGIHATTLTIAATTVSDNEVDQPGTPAVANSAGGGFFADVATVATSTITGNTATGGGTAGGGFASELTMTGSTVDDNQALDDGSGLAFGGGLVVDGGSITTSTISANTVDSVAFGFGGGVVAGPTEDVDVTITDTTIEGNTASHFGGGLQVSGESVTVDVVDSTIAGNDAGDVGGGIHIGGGEDLTLSVSRSLVAGNEAVDGGGLAVGFDSNAQIDVTDSTLSGNTASDRGGAAYIETDFVDFARSTITANTAGGTGAAAGGIQHAGGDFTLDRTVVTDQLGGRDCAGLPPGYQPSQGYNVDSANGCRLHHPTDQKWTAAALGPLADNGGPTETHLPLVGSPLLDQVPLGANDCGTHPDQRAVTRPVGTHCDIGAVEHDPTAFWVTSSVDEVDATPGDGTCASASDGCTLRAAIDEANATAGPDTIHLTDGATYPLTLVGAGEDANQTGDLDATDDLTVEGHGATIDAGGDGGLGDRVLETHAATTDLTLRNLTVTGGRLADQSSRMFGGGLRLAGPGALDTVAVTDNEAICLPIECNDVTGGGISAVDLDIVDSVISDNAASNDEDAWKTTGGGVATSTLTMSDTTVSDNRATLGDTADEGLNGGGGIVATTSAVIDGSTIAGNTASALEALGGGVLVTGTLTLTDTLVHDNVAYRVGGGVAAFNGTIVDSTIADNVVTLGTSGGLHIGQGTIADTTVTGNEAFAAGGVGGAEIAAGLTLLRTTIDGNMAVTGGGILLFSNGFAATMTVVDSAITNNTSDQGGGATVEGDLATLDIVNSTVSGNTAAASYTGEEWDGYEPGSGGAIYVVDEADLLLSHSTVTANSADAGGGVFFSNTLTPPSWSAQNSVIGGQLLGADCVGVPGAFTSFGHNLDSDTTCGLDDPTDQSGVAPLLGPLADNGGPTWTHLPLIGSPLLDHIPLGTNGCGTSADQRGVARPQGTHCDIGSVER